MRNFLIVATIVLTAAAAQAQPAPWQPVRTSAGWTFTPGAVFGTAWDSNVTVRGEGEPLTREWVALISPRGELDYNGRRTRFNVGYSGSFEAYRRFSELNRYEQRGRLELRHQASSRVGVFARGGVTISPTTDRLEVGNGTIPFVDVGSQLLSATSGVRLDAGSRVHLELAYRFQDVRFDERDADQFELLRGGYAHAPGATLMYDVSRRLSLGA
jgi:hypothetical protein